MNINTDANGSVYVVWSKYGSNAFQDWNSISFTKSINGGINWSTPVVILSGLLGNGKWTCAGPSMTVNMQTGDIFIVWSNEGTPNRAIIKSNKLVAINNIYFSKSTDGGNNWTLPAQVNQNNTSGNFKIYPWISCDPSTGLLACVFYGVELLQTTSGGRTFVSVSTNSGDSWCDMQVSDGGDKTIIRELGNDYIGIAMSKGIAYPVWSHMKQIGSNYYAVTHISPIDVIQRNLTVYPELNHPVYLAANSITTSGIFTTEPPYSVSFEAGYYIDLTDGFKYTASGSNTFHAYIPYCSSGSNDIDNNLPVRSNTINTENFKSKENKADMPSSFELSQNYPNPFNLSTIIKYALKNDVNVTIKIYDVLGREVRALVNEFQIAGYKTID